MRVIDCSDSKSFRDKVELIPKQLHIVRYRNKKSPYWYALVKLLKGQGKAPTPRSLKTSDQSAAAEKAFEVWRELTAQFQATGSVSPKSIKALCQKWVAQRELMNRNGEKGGSDSLTGAHRNIIGTLVPAFCEFKGYKKPLDFDREFSSHYIAWRKEEAPKIIGLKLDGTTKSGANTKLKKPGQATIFRELQIIRQWTSGLVEEELLNKPIKIPVRSGFVPPPEDDFESNPPFELDDFKAIIEAYKKWITKKDPNMRQDLKMVIYTKFLIDCSVGWRPYSEGNQAIWSWVKNIYEEEQRIKDQLKVFKNSHLSIWDSKRKRWRNGYFIRGHQFSELYNQYMKWSEADPSKIKPTRDGFIFYDPSTGKKLSEDQCYSNFKKRLDECHLQRENYTYYSCRSFMVTERGNEGARPDVIAEFTGHDLRILKKHYQRLNAERVAPMATVRTTTGLHPDVDGIKRKNLFTAFQ